MYERRNTEGAQGCSYAYIAVRQGSGKRMVSLNQDQLAGAEGKTRELIVVCSGDWVVAALDGQPLPVVEEPWHGVKSGPSGRLQFNARDGAFRLLSIDQRQLETIKDNPMERAVLPVLSAPASDNPFGNAHVNDFVEYKNGNAIMKLKIIKKDQTDAVMTITYLNGKQVVGEGPPIAISLQQPFDPLHMYFGPNTTRLGEGDETITVQGKAYKCHWVQAKFMSPLSHKEITEKVWISADVPLTGLVRLDKGYGLFEFSRSGSE